MKHVVNIFTLVIMSGALPALGLSNGGGAGALKSTRYEPKEVVSCTNGKTPRSRYNQFYQTARGDIRLGQMRNVAPYLWIVRSEGEVQLKLLSMGTAYYDYCDRYGNTTERSKNYLFLKVFRIEGDIVNPRFQLQGYQPVTTAKVQTIGNPLISKAEFESAQYIHRDSDIDGPYLPYLYDAPDAPRLSFAFAQNNTDTLKVNFIDLCGKGEDLSVEYFASECPDGVCRELPRVIEQPIAN